MVNLATRFVVATLAAAALFAAKQSRDRRRSIGRALTSPRALSSRHDRSPAEAGRRRLADGPAHLRRLGLQPAGADHAGERCAPRAGLELPDRREQRTRSAADRQRRRDVRRDPGQSGASHSTPSRGRCSGDIDVRCPRASCCCIPQRGASRCTATRCSSRPARPCWWRSMPAPARKCGRPPSPRTRTATTCRWRRSSPTTR